MNSARAAPVRNSSTVTARLLDPLPRFTPSIGRAEALARLTETFRLHGIEDSRREARISLCAAIGVSQVGLTTAPLEPLGSSASRVEEFARRRVSREPLSRIVGKREFWGLPLIVSPEVLDPRPETETIIEAAISILRERRDEPLRILDLGVGSGALLCGLLTEFRNARGVGVDVSPGAARVALENLASCGLAARAEIRIGDWTTGIEGPFDLIVSNPPYIATADLPDLPPEVRDFDPWLALDGGSDGLAAYRQILPQSAVLLAPHGWLAVEFGAEQAAEILAIATQFGFTDTKIVRDLAGLDRVLTARL
jgi:release factor glutamine methyltransferase